MNKLTCFFTSAVLVLLAGKSVAAPMGTAFTYQGRLGVGTNAANGSFDIEMRLHDALASGLQVAGPTTNLAVSVSNGLFTINVDLGGVAFDGNVRWLGIAVRTNGGGAFTGLTPRQELKPAPYALFASNAAVAAFASTVAAGSVGNAGLQAGAVDSSRILDGSIGTNDLSPTLLNNTFWKLLGNGGTTAGVNFLGTTDNQPVEIKVNGQRGFRVEPTVASPNVMGGSSFITTWLPGYPVGGTIGGGTSNMMAWFGLPSDPPDNGTIGGGINNRIFAAEGNTIGGGGENLIEHRVTTFSTIGGGKTNSISFARNATIGGGDNNRIQSDEATIAGGSGNFINGGDFLTPAFSAVIGGGANNSVGQGSSGGTIAGGYNNKLMHFVDGGTIGGGVTNTIWQFSRHSTIAGGAKNQIGTFSNLVYAAAISGGEDNLITNSFASIAGGSNNFAGGYASAIAGGADNSVRSDYGTVSGGQGNTINSLGSSTATAAIGGGSLNSIFDGGSQATIGGGYSNTIGGFGFGGEGGPGATISGGANNLIRGTSAGGNSSSYSTIGGGQLNTIFAMDGNTISGGSGNTIADNHIQLSTIGGGANNRVAGLDTKSASIFGGKSNYIEASYATIAGGLNNHIGFSVPLGNEPWYSTIGGGFGSSIGQLCVGATIAGGAGNQISGVGVPESYATVGGGRSNAVNGAYGTIPGGLQAATRSYGQMAHASGQFAQAGDAQTSTYVLRGVSTNASETEIFLDGASARMKIPTNSTWGFDMLITGRTSAGMSAFYVVRGVVENNGGTTLLSVTPTKDYTFEDNATWNAIIDVDDPTDSLVIRVAGAAATTIRWVASVRVVEIIY